MFSLVPPRVNRIIILAAQLLGRASHQRQSGGKSRFSLSVALRLFLSPNRRVAGKCSPSVRLPSRLALLLRLSATSLNIKMLLPENKIGPLIEGVFSTAMAVFSISRLPLGEHQGREGTSAGGTCNPGTQEVSWPHP